MKMAIAYFTLITKDNRLTERLYPGRDCLIFSRNLLKQFNYHVNVADNNGFITEGNTYFPWSLDKAVKKIKENSLLPLDEEDISYHRMNEVVFHDSVPIEYLCMDMPKGDTGFLPDKPIENDVAPNLSLLPFYCFAQPEEDNRLTSSYAFFQKFADFCGVDRSLPKDEIIDKIKEKMSFLQSNREKQNIGMLRKMYKRKTQKGKRKGGKKMTRKNAKSAKRNKPAV